MILYVSEPFTVEHLKKDMKGLISYLMRTSRVALLLLSHFLVVVHFAQLSFFYVGV